jgi:hypothetical protein
MCYPFIKYISKNLWCLQKTVDITKNYAILVLTQKQTERH